MKQSGFGKIKLSSTFFQYLLIQRKDLVQVGMQDVENIAKSWRFTRESLWLRMIRHDYSSSSDIMLAFWATHPLSHIPNVP